MKDFIKNILETIRWHLKDVYGFWRDKIKVFWGWKAIYVVLFVAIMGVLLLTPDSLVQIITEILNQTLDNNYAVAFIGVVYFMEIVRNLAFRKMTIRNDFVPLLRIVLEAATYIVVVESSLSFLRAMTQQFIVESGESHFSSYFNGVDFLAFTFTSIFLIAFSIISISKVIVMSFLNKETNIVGMATKEVYEIESKNYPKNPNEQT